MVLKARAMSMSPENEMLPNPPLQGPHLVTSSSSINYMALTFGAPLTVPTGKADHRGAYMHDMGESLDSHELFNIHRTSF